MSIGVRLVGINHVGLVVGDLEEALAFYGELFDLELRGRVEGKAFVDIGDQFVALSEGPVGEVPTDRHFGLVVDDLDAARGALEAAGVELASERSVIFRDPWGNPVQLVDYRDVEFSKHPAVLEGMGLSGLGKRSDALAELREKGLGG